MKNVLKDNLSALKEVSKMISYETGCNIIICDQNAQIIEATDHERIGRTHMGSQLILSGETDEAVISKADEVFFTMPGTDTRAGYNYVIMIQGQRVGSLGVAGDPLILKPIVRIAAKTISIYISKYLEEKEKNKVIQKMARIAEEIIQETSGKIDHQLFADDLKAISGAEYVLFNMYSTEGNKSKTVAFSGCPEDIFLADTILGSNLVGNEWISSAESRDRVRNKGIVHFNGINEFCDGNFLAPSQIEQLETRLGLGSVYCLEVAHKKIVLGDFILIYLKDSPLKNAVLVELFAAQVGQLLMRVQAEAALKKSENQYRMLVERINDVIFNIDENGDITYVSPAVERLLNFKPAEVMGTKFADYIHPKDLAKVKVYFLRALSGKERTLIFRMIDKNDKIYHVRVFTTLLNKEQESGLLLGILTDVTELKDTEERLKHLSLHDSLTGVNNRTFFERQIKKLNNSGDYPLTIISLDADGLKLINDTIGHYQGDKILKDLANILKQSIRSSDKLARIGGDEFVVILPGACHETAEAISTRIKDNIKIYNEQNSKIPLSVSIGLCTIEKPGDPLEEVLKKADEHMYHNKLFQKESSRNQILDSLMATLAERDYITQGHTQRLLDLCMKVGKKKKLAPGVLTSLALLSQVHDLGKVGIPDRILFKPGPLTEEEWDIMKQHPQKGHRIAMASPDLKDIAHLILRHHERWDGKGYPLGLKGEEIPIECRILSVVDSYDTITNIRRYCEAMSKEKAVQEIKSCSGTQFDPEIVELFLEVLAEQTEQECENKV